MNLSYQDFAGHVDPQNRQAHRFNSQPRFKIQVILVVLIAVFWVIDQMLV